jgi:very-short-patch-repair endonuclease
MAHQIIQRLAAKQHGVVSRVQLLRLGLSAEAVKHAVASGRLHPVARGVYAVGRAELGRDGLWTAALMACGPDAVLSHSSAAELWGIGPERPGTIEVSVPARRCRRRRGVVVHRRVHLETTAYRGFPSTAPAATLIDLAARSSRRDLEAAVNAADRAGLIDPERLRTTLETLPRRPGIAALRALLDRHTFVLTDSELERRFLRLARAAGLPRPETGRRLNGFKVDFFWRELGLVVETDGLRYHRTPATQARDRLRDQAHATAGLTPLRFTHAQVAHERRHVIDTLRAVADRLREAR